ncbi:MAG TPA: hypothetical protein VJ372_17695 [Pyrinomonadaceae bacterium]|jgi:hypothetical protein|nr:hypothetical protein [Pyrinomonadaceae bacterium]
MSIRSILTPSTIIRVLTAIITFSVGWATSSAVSHLRDWFSERSPKVITVTKSLTTGNDDEWVTYKTGFNTSDSLTFSCVERPSAADALAYVRKKGLQIIAHTNVLDQQGLKVGERTVRYRHDDVYSQAIITWNDGQRLFTINATSLEQALRYEGSKTVENRLCNMSEEIITPRKSALPLTHN